MSGKLVIVGDPYCWQYFVQQEEGLGREGLHEAPRENRERHASSDLDYCTKTGLAAPLSTALDVIWPVPCTRGDQGWISAVQFTTMYAVAGDKDTTPVPSVVKHTQK